MPIISASVGRLESDYVEGSLVFKCYITGRGKVPSSIPISADLTEIDRLCKDFWSGINGLIIDLKADYSTNREKLFYDKMAPLSNELTEGIIRSSDFRNAVHNVAIAVDKMIIVTRLFQIPWNLLFFSGTEGGFLQDLCNVIIFPVVDDIGYSDEDATAGDDWGIVIDRHLEKELCQKSHADPEYAEKLRGKIRAVKDKAAEGGLVLCDPDTYTDFSVSLKTLNYIHVISHYEPNKGIRINEDIFYSHREVKVYPFPNRCNVFLSSCTTGISDEGLNLSLAATISSTSNCLVIASCCKIPLEDACDIFLEFDAYLRSSSNYDTSMDEIWRKFRLDKKDILPFIFLYELYGLSKFEFQN